MNEESLYKLFHEEPTATVLMRALAKLFEIIPETEVRFYDKGEYIGGVANIKTFATPTNQTWLEEGGSDEE